MRTTVELPDEVFRQVKVLAAHRGVTVKSLVQGAIEEEIRRARSRPARRRLRFPILSSKEPGTLKLTNAQIEDLLT